MLRAAAVAYEGGLSLTKLCDPSFGEVCAAERVAWEKDALRSP